MGTVKAVFCYIAALYGIIFPKDLDAAFSCFRLWESVGFVISFGYSSFLCTYIKLYILLGLSLLSIICYGMLECTISSQSRAAKLLDTFVGNG